MAVSISGEGAISGSSSYSFDSNVSIAGTTTIEDVTSVDSVGIITAQSGIRVTGGKVGIGTNNPQFALDISDGSSSGVRIGVGTHAYRIRANVSSSNDYGFFIEDEEGTDLYNVRGPHATSVPNVHRFYTQGTERVRITPAGNVGINESSPGGLLQVGASSGSHVIITPNIGLDINDGALNLYQATSNVNATPFIISTDVGGTETEKLRFTGGGNLGIGTADPQEKLHVSGGNIKLDDGYGIDFSHVVSPNPGASASNSLLDDYEEGTWDAVLRYHTSVGDTSGTGNNGISASEARYTKIGNLVYITCSFTTASTAYYVYQEIRNLPFTPQRAGVLNLYVRGGRYRYAGGASADAFFYGGIYASDLTINTGSERTDTTSSGWVELLASSQLFRVCGSYLTS